MRFYIDKNRRKKALAVLIAAGMFLTGCGKGLPMGADVSQAKAYTLPQTMIVVATERNQYQEIYTSQIWGVELPDGETFEDYLLGQVKEFLQEMKTMNLLAKEQEITLSGDEKEELGKLADEYYQSLSKEDIAYMGITKDDVETMYEEYYLSNKVVSELTKDMDLEISDSEAKVITIQQIVLSDGNTAADVYGEVTAEGADFSAIAKEYSEETVTQRQIGRGEEPGALEDAAFALAKDEISNVVSYDGKYYIVRCVNDYEEAATAERKEQLHIQRKKEAFDRIYDQFKADHPLTFEDDMWDNIRFSIDDKTSTTDFFKLYKKHFPES